MRGNISSRVTLRLAAVVGLVLALAGSAQAVVILVGDDPATGTTWELGAYYRFAFVSGTKTQATSTDINTYNTFLQNLADASSLNIGTARGATWKVIGSTSTVDARDNTASNPAVNGTGEGIFLVDGTTVMANNYADLWDGSIDHTLSMDENGIGGYGGDAFSGTNTDGTKRGRPLGGSTETPPKVTIGRIHSAGGQWLVVYNTTTTNSLPIYALSDPLIFGGEPLYWDLNDTNAGACVGGGDTADGTWNGSNSYWNTAADGNGTPTVAWTAGKAAVFAAGADATGIYTVTVDGTQDISGLGFQEGTVTLSGSAVLRLVVPIAPVVVHSGLTATVETPISEDVAGRELAKYGPGTLVLSGANTYTGATTVVDGTLRLDANDVLPDASAVTVHGGNAGETATLDLAGNDDTIASLTLGGSTTTSGAAVTTGAGTLTLGGDVAYNSAHNPLGATISGKVDLGSAARTFEVGDSSSADDDLTVSADISGTGVGLTKAGDGTLVLSGTNTYAGPTVVSAGVLWSAAPAALPGYDSPGNVVFDGGTLAVRVGGSDWATGDVDTLLAGATKTSGGLGIDTSNGDLTQWTAFTPTNLGTLGLTKLGSNALTLDQANTYTGATTVNAGTLVLPVANACASAMVVNAGTLRLTNTDALASSSALTLADGSTLELRSDTSATFNTPGDGTTSFATLAHPGATVTIDVGNNGSGTGNELTLSGGIGFDAPSGGTSTINITSGNGYVLRTPVIVDRMNNNTSTLVLNPTTASVIVTDLTHGFVAGGGLYLTLGGTSPGNEVTSPPDTSWLYIKKEGTSTWTWSADVPSAQALGSCVISGGNLIVTGTLRAQGADTRSVQVNTGGVLHYNNAGAVDTSNRTDVYLVFGGGSLDNTSGAAITTSTYNPRQYWKGNVTFIGSNGADSDLNLGTGEVKINGNRTVTVQDPDTTLTVGGVISGTNAAYGLTKAGPGRLVLNGVNTYTGATNVNAGTLGGTGTIAGPVTVQEFAALAPGSALDPNGSAAALTTASLTMDATSLYEWEISPAAADKVVVSGDLTLTEGWSLKLIDAGGTPTGEYDLFTYTGSFFGSVDAIIDPTGDWTSAQISLDTVGGRVYLSLGITGDADGDGDVDAADYIALKTNMGQPTGATTAQGDFDGDGDVDWYDLQILQGNYGAGSAGASTIPEPATLGLLAIGAVAVLRRRR